MFAYAVAVLLRSAWAVNELTNSLAAEAQQLRWQRPADTLSPGSTWSTSTEATTTSGQWSHVCVWIDLINTKLRQRWWRCCCWCRTYATSEEEEIGEWMLYACVACVSGLCSLLRTLTLHRPRMQRLLFIVMASFVESFRMGKNFLKWKVFHLNTNATLE